MVLRRAPVCDSGTVDRVRDCARVDGVECVETDVPVKCPLNVQD